MNGTYGILFINCILSFDQWQNMAAIAKKNHRGQTQIFDYISKTEAFKANLTKG